jgi:hypothetical protein
MGTQATRRARVARVIQPNGRKLRHMPCERQMAQTTMTEVLERGNIYFAFRPKVEYTSAEGIEDIQRFFVILSPHGKKRYRLIIIGRKKLPAIRGEHERNWAFVQKVSRAPEEIEDELDRLTYQTATRGERHLSPVRPAGERVYAIALHDDHTHLAFALELPEEPGDVQRELNIPSEGSYIVTVKNPEVPAEASLSRTERPDMPARLGERFRGRLFIPLNPPEFLDQEGTEMVLIGADERVFEELGLRLDPERETIETAKIFNDLRMERTAHPLKPLFEGRWQ